MKDTWTFNCLHYHVPGYFLLTSTNVTSNWTQRNKRQLDLLCTMSVVLISIFPSTLVAVHVYNPLLSLSTFVRVMELLE